MEMGIKELKDKQRQAIMTFVQGQDAFVLLPTGYRKSMIYALLPLVFDVLLVGCQSMYTLNDPLFICRVYWEYCVY